jgi:hypothetical protein
MRLARWLAVVAALAGPRLSPAAPSGTQLLVPISRCQVSAVREMLEGGADPNARSAGGPPVQFLAAGRGGCSDADALEVAKLLDAHGVRFGRPAGKTGPSLLVNLAPRHLPRTLAFLASKPEAGDPTEALRAIARRDDLESVRALLAAGGDPTVGVASSSALLDAVLADRAECVVEMLKRVHDLQSPKVLAAFHAASKGANPQLVAAFTRAGLKPPAVPTPTPPACSPRPLRADESSLLTRLGIQDEARQCKFLQACGDLLLVDCNSAADGPAYYLDGKAEKVLSTCGGACMRGCTNCPPEAWTCTCRR